MSCRLIFSFTKQAWEVLFSKSLGSSITFPE